MLLLLFSRLSYAWWGHSHIVIASIAENSLSSHQAKIITAALNGHGLPTHTIPSCASWQDDILNDGKLSTMANWHYSDGPIVDPSFQGKLPEDTYNVTSYLHSAFKSMLDPTTTDPWVIAFHLRSIIHFVGDVHTPHHNCALFSDRFPNGDMGGNEYKLNCNYGSACMNMHFLWDSAGLSFPLYSPLLPIYRDDLKKNISAVSNYKLDTYDLKLMNPSNWSSESFAVAKQFGYASPIYEWPNSSYFATVQDCTKKRIAASGHRLGTILRQIIEKQENTLEKIYGNSASIGILPWTLNLILFTTSIALYVLQKKNLPIGEAVDTTTNKPYTAF